MYAKCSSTLKTHARDYHTVFLGKSYCKYVKYIYPFYWREIEHPRNFFIWRILRFLVFLHKPELRRQACSDTRCCCCSCRSALASPVLPCGPAEAGPSSRVLHLGCDAADSATASAAADNPPSGLGRRGICARSAEGGPGGCDDDSAEQRTGGRAGAGPTRPPRQRARAQARTWG